MFKVDKAIRRLRTGIRVNYSIPTIRHVSLTLEEIQTQMSDTSDPNRTPFFQYSWGSWMKNDKIEKAKRQTRFSIEGTTNLVQAVLQHSKQSSNIDESGDLKIQTPKSLNDGSTVLTQNSGLVGDSQDSLMVRSIASIHEGKHHRIYKLTLSNSKELVLRLPYKLESEYAIGEKIKSEVATNDFLNLRLGLKVPKILAFDSGKVNFIQSPYILMEYIPGDLLMKQWEPLINDEIPDSKEKLLDVIKPISDFQNQVNSITFNKFGSLYFTGDVEGSLQTDLPYEGETNPDLVNRWRIGPSVEKAFFKNKSKLSPGQISAHNGPWDADKPEQLIESIAKIELESLSHRLGLAQADSSSTVEDLASLKLQIETFEHLLKMAPLLINKNSKSIPNAEELFKPRLFLSDLDPLNVILNSERNNELVFTDFEYATIKPFIYTSYPNFVAYSGVKIYDLESDVPEYKDMDEVDKQQYQFMYYKTRNERLWELELNQNRHDLIAVASPHIKVLKSPYLQALELKTDKDYLYVEGSISQLRGLWEAYVTNELCNGKEIEFPIDVTTEQHDEFQLRLQEYQSEISLTPFAATGGWVPQDMFEQLQEHGIIVKQGDDYKIDADKVLQETK